ncbi:MAG: (deoxy)nucleoside triphosphate pyrophosphohydrolase [Gammaproteobacteria bacterium]|nr:(deoxy)nucleoside triphosphate pyrophosphohydrolase [Gammaproteobacteria bacterium]
MKVAVAVIFDEKKRILITQRAANIPSGGLWEFPGGKLEPDESPEAALIREVKEEVNLDVVQYRFISQIDEQRAQHTLSLFVFFVHQFHGKAIRRESQQDLLWVETTELSQFQFPPTNQKILTWIS